MSTKPEPLFVNGEAIYVDDDPIMGGLAMAVVGRCGNLSPYEAQELRDWLNKFLAWYYEKER